MLFNQYAPADGRFDPDGNALPIGLVEPIKIGQK
jgi:hypothetical protein